MRTLGVAVLGLFVGLLTGLMLTEAIARALVGGSGEVSTGQAMLSGLLMPALGIVGVVVALVIDVKTREKP